MVRLVGRGKMGMVAVITGIWLHQRRRIGGRWPCGHRGGQGRCPWGRMGPGRHADCVLGYHDCADGVRQEEGGRASGRGWLLPCTTKKESWHWI